MAKMNKVQLNTTVSEEAKRKADTYGGSPTYGSTSNFVETAIWYYIGAIEREKEMKFEECKNELERMRQENEHRASIILKLLSKYPDLTKDVNVMEQQNHSITSRMIKLD